jgi:hypothetical protein
MALGSSIFFRRFLTGGMVLAAAWWFHSHRLVPLQQREVECMQALSDVRQRISDAKAKIHEIGKQEKAAGDARALLDSLQGDVPKDSAAVWLPLRLRTHLRNAGITEARIRVNPAMVESVVADSEQTFFAGKLRTHQRTGGIAEGGIRAAATVREPGVPGYERTYWQLNLPGQDGMRSMSEVLQAVAEIERQEPSMRILDLSFVAASEAPHWPAGEFNVTALVPK